MNTSTKKIRSAFLIVLTLTIILPIISALDFNPVQTQNAKEGNLLEFTITITGNNGTVNFSRTPSIGTLTKMSNTEAKFSWTPQSGDAGIYELQVTAQDATETKTKNITINVTQNNPPIIISTAGGGLINEDKTKIYAVTDKTATCKYSTESKTYPSMEYTMLHLNAGKTEHEGITPSLSQGMHTIYILCRDTEGNTMTTPTQINIESNLRPTAAISLSPSPPLKGGTVKVTLTASEDLIYSPKLEYTFSDDSKLIPVPLEGNGRHWTGYLVISSTEQERVGSFIFKGYDLTNVEGTEITSGKIFLVDNKPPGSIQSIDITSENDRIKLEWRYPDTETDNIKEYNIYRRKMSGGVDYVDFYETTTRTYHYDNDVKYNEAYYYRVTAVDNAGNEGPLSKEVFITHKPDLEIKEDEETTVTGLSEKLQYVLDIELQKIDKIIMDVNQAEQSLGKMLGADNLEVIETLQLLREIKTASNKITSLKSELNGLRTKQLTESAFQSNVDRIISEANEEWKKTPKAISIIDSTNYKELIEDQKTTEIIQEYIKEKYPDAKSTSKTIEEAKKIQDTMIIDVTLIKAEILYPEESKPVSIIRKVINLDYPEEIVVLEKIPEKISEDITKITYKQQPGIIRNSNIAYWEYISLEKNKIVYSIPSDINIADLKSVKTVVFSESESEKQNLITGMAADENKGGANILFILIIAGVVAIFGLGAYYVFSDNEAQNETKRFIPNMNLFRKKDNTHIKIIPDEDKKLDIEIEKKERPAQTSYQVISKQAVQETKTDEKVINEEPKHDLDALHKKLEEYKEKAEHAEDLDEIDSLREKTVKIRTLCDEIEEKNIRAYTQKTKEYLEKTLSYMNRKLEDKQPMSETPKTNPLTVQAPQGKTFKMADGTEIRSLEELAHHLEFMSNETFSFHVNEQKNDFANWTRDVFKENDLAHKMRSSKTREELKKNILA